MRPVENGLNWEIVGSKGFEKTIEALLSRIHDGDRIEFPEGRGGDGGRDAIVFTSDGRTVIYQFKFYPDGISTSGSSRKRAVEKSFKAALAHDPDEWVLIFPGKMTDAFRRLFFGLARGKTVKVDFIDRPRLDSMLARHRDLVDLLKQDDLLMERARVLGREALILKGGAKDAMAHRAALVEAMDRLHPYWGLHMEEVNGTPTFTPYAKTTNAQERSPLGLHVSVTVSKTDKFADDLRNALNFGHPGMVTIPGPNITALKWTGDTEWMGFDDYGHPDEFELHTASIAVLDGASVRITTHDQIGKPTSSHRGMAKGEAEVRLV